MGPKLIRLLLALTGALLAITGRLPGISIGLALTASYAIAFERHRLRRLGKPRFWLFSTLVLLLAGLLLGSGERSELLGLQVSLEGLLAGVEMVLRAFTLVLAGVLLSASITRDRFISLTSRVGLPHFDPAFTTALDTLPRVGHSWREARGEEGRAPLRSLARLLLMLADLAHWQPLEGAQIHAVTGRRGAGKTSLLHEIARRAEAAGLTVGGFLQAREDGEERTGAYRVVRWGGGGQARIAERRAEGGYAFSEAAFAEADGWLRADSAKADLLLIDELGLLELRGEGHAPSLVAALQRSPDTQVLVTLRKDRLMELCERFGIGEERRLDLDGEADRDRFAHRVLLAAGANEQSIPEFRPLSRTTK